MEINQIISDNLKRLRMERNLSLGQLAELSGVSKVMLCQIEKGDTNPTINTIWKIANGLKVSYTALMEKSEHVATVIAKSDIVMQNDEDGHYRLYCYYPTSPQRNFEVFQVELDAGYSHTTIGHSEKSQEYIMILEGELSFTVNDQTFILHQDEAISFTASAKHTYCSSGKETMKAYLINYYPA